MIVSAVLDKHRLLVVATSLAPIQSQQHHQRSQWRAWLSDGVLLTPNAHHNRQTKAERSGAFVLSVLMCC